MSENLKGIPGLCGIIETDNDIDRKLAAFYDLHLNCGINLTAIKDKEDFYLKHYADSVYYFDKYMKPEGSLADIGSGGGFPGIVLAIFYNNLSVTLVESIGKKCVFLREAAELLGLRNVKVINDRAENIKGMSFDIITARGVSKVKDVLGYTFGMSTKGTKWVLYKGERLDEELDDAKNLILKKELKVDTIRLEKPFTRTYCVIGR